MTSHCADDSIQQQQESKRAKRWKESVSVTSAEIGSLASIRIARVIFFFWGEEAA